MIKAEFLGRETVLICDCGNADQDRFINYAMPIFVHDKKGRQKLRKILAKTCRVCNSSTPQYMIDASLKVDKEQPAV